jgi:hypothetical protein
MATAPAERMAYENGAAELEPRVQVEHGICKGVDAVGKATLRWLLALAKTRQIRRHHAILAPEHIAYLVPRAVVHEQAMQQQQARPRPGFVDPQPHAVCLDVTLDTGRSTCFTG